MVPKIIWSPEARADLGNIAREIGQDRAEFAVAYCLRLMEKIEGLALFPMSGRQFPGQASPNLREFIIPPYRVIYELRTDSCALDVLRVWDARRGDPQFSRPASP